jgi:hypothetical protein
MKMGSAKTDHHQDGHQQKDALYAEFAKRLNSALDHAGIPKLNKGRQVALKHRMRVSQEAVRKWLAGESIPRHERLVQLSQWLAVSYAWLVSGEADELREPEQTYASNRSKAASSPHHDTSLLQHAASLPIRHADGSEKRWLFSHWCDAQSPLFAFEVNDAHMQPTYRQNDVVFINPHIKPEAGHAVLVDFNPQPLSVRRLLRASKNQLLLSTDNTKTSHTQTVELSGKIRILGVVTRLLRVEVPSPS